MNPCCSRERKSPDVCENLPFGGAGKKSLWAPPQSLAQFLAPTTSTYPFSWTSQKRRILRTRRRTGTRWHALWYNRINSTDYSVAKDKTRDAAAIRSCTKPTSRREGERERKKDKKLDIIHGTSSLVALYVFVRRHTHTHTLSRAGLHPRPLRHNVDRTEEITERQSASAHSVRRVYMTMSKWGDV